MCTHMHNSVCVGKLIRNQKSQTTPMPHWHSDLSDKVREDKRTKNKTLSETQVECKRQTE